MRIKVVGHGPIVSMYLVSEVEISNVQYLEQDTILPMQHRADYRDALYTALFMVMQKLGRFYKLSACKNINQNVI